MGEKMNLSGAAKFLGSLLLAVGLIPLTTYSQSGPGGVGNSGGTSGQPKNMVWLRGESGVTQSGTVDSWADQSGNGLTATGSGGTRPSYVASDANFNSLPVISFTNTGTNKHLVIADQSTLDNTTGLTMFAVFRANSTSTTALISKRTDVDVDQSYMMWVGTALNSRISSNSIAGGTISTSTTSVGTTVFNGASTTVANFLNGASAASGTGPSSIPDNASDLYIGAFDISSGETRNFDGRIGEVVIYTTALNAAQRQIVENYLAAKYNLTITGDVYAGDASAFDFDVAGIGRNSSASHTEAHSAGLVLTTYNGTLDTDGEFLLAGRGSAANSVVNCACTGYPGTIQQRWARTWYIDKTTAGTLDASIGFDFGDGIGGSYPQNKDDYELLYSSDGGVNFSIVSVSSSNKVISGDRMSFRVASASLLDGIYTIGTTNATDSPIDGAANKTWYSYQTGNANDPLVWTLDGGVTPLYVNPSNEVPSAADNVVITTGKTITVTLDNFAANNLEVYGTLDLVQTSGHSTSTIAGTGRIRIAGSSSNLDNFPSGNATAFANSSTGGTVEIYGTSTFTLDQVRVYNDLVLNKTSGVVSLAANLTLNGDFTLTSGEFRFGSVASELTVYGDTQVNSGSTISVVSANVRHQFNVYGHFTNNSGMVQFTNRVAANYTVEATDGIVDFNLLNDTGNQRVVCNGVTRFYRIEIDKGTDDTYSATFTANSNSNFLLYGYANEDHPSTAQLTSTANSFALLRGTAEIGTNIVIPVLSNNGNYNISAAAMLWVNGGTVRKNNGNSLVPYGKVKVTTGALESNVVAGITTRDNGTIIVEGGSVTTNQIRTSVLGSSNVGGYVQSGGTVTVNGGGPGGTGLDYYVFSLTYTGNVFQMSGGTLTVKGARSGTAGTRGAIFINSDPANVSVTGGTVIAEISNANPYVITSRAPFWNLIARNTFSTTLRDVDILGGTSGVAGGGAAEVTLPAQDLVILGGLTIENYVNFDHNGKDISIQGNLTIATNGDLEYDVAKPNTTTFDGEDNSLLTFNNHFTASAGDEQFFWNFVIDKPSDKVVSFESGKTDRTGSNNNLLRINGSAFKLYSGILDQGSHSVRMYCDTVLNYGTLGVFLTNATNDNTPNDRNDLIKFRDDNSPTVLLTVDNALFGAVRLISGDEAIELVSDVHIQFLQFNYGRIDLGTHNLKLDELRVSLGNEADSLGLATGGAFSVEDMFILDGNNSDGGLSIYVPAGTANNTKYTFPIGIGFAIDASNNPNGAVYTQARVNVKNVVDDGYITINPVQQVLQTTNLSGGSDIISYYWRVRHQGFSTLPTVSYQFIYDQSDAGGTETNYIPGKVLDSNPFTRSADGNTTDVNETYNVITFNGTTNNGTFPGAGFTLENANYTTGETNRFTGTVRVLYTRELADGAGVDWTNTNYWTLGTNASFGVHDSRQTSAGTYPQAGDIAVIGWVPFGDPAGNNGAPHGIAMNATQAVAEVRFTKMLDASNNPTQRVFYRNFQFRPTVVLNNLGTQGQIASGASVSGEGLFWIRSTGGNLSDPAFTGVDLGDFNSQDSSYFIYENTLGTGTYLNLPSEFPNLMMTTDGWGNQDKNSIISKDITVNGDMELLGNVNLLLNTGANGDITVNRNLRFYRSNANGNDSGGGGELRYGNTGTARTVAVAGDLILGNGYDAIVRVLTPGTTPITHRFDLYGDFMQNTTVGNGFKAGTSSTQDRIHVNLLGDNAMTLAVTSGDVPQFYSLTVNKGSSTATTATINSNITIDAPTNTTTKPLTLTSGLLKLNHASISVTLSTGGGNFSIPSGAGLEVTLGTVNMTGSDTGLLLDGLLKVSGGTVSLDDAVGNGNNYIEYSASGNAIIEVTNGTLTVGSQIRRNLTSTAGILKYRQSGGAVVVGRRAAPTTSRGVFEVVNNGSEFTHTAGTLTLVRGINSTTVPSLRIQPQTPAAIIDPGSDIIIGNANTPTGANGQNIGILTSRRLGKLTISNASGNSPKALVYSSPLLVDGDLTINAGATLDAQGFGMTLRGNMFVNGTFIPNGNTVSFATPSTRSISGTGTIDFFNLSKSGAAVLNVLSSITVNGALAVQNGTLADNGNTITLLGNASFGTNPSTSGSHTSTAGGLGIVFAGTSQQQLAALRTNGVASLGTITIRNSNGVVIPDQADKFTINTALRLDRGVLDIGGSLLNFATTAEIEEVNLFSVTNMIQTNSSFTDNGVSKSFAAGRTADFTYPVGQLLYTPVTFDFADIGSGTGAGSTISTITVRPANERQPIVVEDVEDGLPASCPNQIDDLNNVLQYHWIITASNATDLESNVTINYDQSLVALANGSLESDYLAARVRTSDNTVFKFPGSVNATTNTISFQFNDVTQSEISGEYLAGIDCAIPNNVIVYVTKGGGLGSGDITDSNIYVGSPSPLTLSGASIQVAAGDIVTFPGTTDNIILYRTEIEGTVEIQSGSIGHRFGTVTGTGTLSFVVNTPEVGAVMPAGFYNDFLSCSGGGLQFSGNASYEVLGGISSLRRLILSGTGSRTLGNNDIVICEDFTLNGPNFLNTNNRDVVIERDLIIGAGTFSSGTGNLEIDRDLIVSGGAFDGQSGGAKVVQNDVNVSAGTFTAGSGGTLTIWGDLLFSGGTFSGGSGTHRTIFQGSSAQATSGTIALNQLEIDNGTGLTLGGSTTVNDQLLLTNGLITPGSNSFILASNATVTPAEGSVNSYVNGRLRKTMAAGSSFTFPIGKGGLWRNAAIINPQPSSATWEFEYYNQIATTDPLVDNRTPASTTIKTISGSEYWKVSDGTVTSSGRTATVGLSWGLESDVSSSSVERQDLVVMLWNDGTSRWDSKGGTNFSAGNTQSRGSFNSSTTISFSEQIVTLGSTDTSNPLPVELVSFTAELVGGVTQLLWETASELNADYFEVQRSATGAEFRSLGVVKSAGTTSVRHFYGFEDQQPLSGKNYYRLKQVDLNGEVTYSDVISVSYDGVVSLGVIVHPNPVKSESVHIRLAGLQDGFTKIRVLDLTGREILVEDLRHEPGSENVTLDISNLAPGVYLVDVHHHEHRVTKRLLKIE